MVQASAARLHGACDGGLIRLGRTRLKSLPLGTLLRVEIGKKLQLTVAHADEAQAQATDRIGCAVVADGAVLCPG